MVISDFGVRKVDNVGKIVEVEIDLVGFRIREADTKLELL